MININNQTQQVWDWGQAAGVLSHYICKCYDWLYMTVNSTVDEYWGHSYHHEVSWVSASLSDYWLSLLAESVASMVRMRRSKCERCPVSTSPARVLVQTRSGEKVVSVVGQLVTTPSVLSLTQPPTLQSTYPWVFLSSIPLPGEDVTS